MQKYWVTVDDVGTTRWYKDAKRTILHRVGGPATEWADGNMHWHLNGKRHRTDGPAIQWPSGDKSWWLNGLLHRTDGAAIELVNGIKKWYLDGEQLTEREFDKATGKATWNFKLKEWKWGSEFDENGVLVKLAAKDENGNLRFNWKKQK